VGARRVLADRENKQQRILLVISRFRLPVWCHLNIEEEIAVDYGNNFFGLNNTKCEFEKGEKEKDGES